MKCFRPLISEQLAVKQHGRARFDPSFLPPSLLPSHLPLPFELKLQLETHLDVGRQPEPIHPNILPTRSPRTLLSEEERDEKKEDDENKDGVEEVGSSFLLPPEFLLFRVDGKSDGTCGWRRRHPSKVGG